MRKFLEFIIKMVLKFAFWFRYRFEIKGLEKLSSENLNRPGGVLLLPNHPAMMVDPVAICLACWSKLRVRPLIVEYMYYAPLIYTIMKFINAIPVPNNEISSNSLKKKRSDKALQEVARDIKKGDNFLLYPSGRLKDTGYEFIGGASGVHRIISENPEANIVLARSIGFWGSSFSKAYTGKSPPIFPTVWHGIKHTIKNLLFFNPRRKITIEFEVAPEDFPRYGTRKEINQYLENWYNRPEGLRDRDSDVIGEPLYQVSYSLWGKEYIEPHPKKIEEEDPEINLDKIPQETKEKVIRKLSEITDISRNKIRPDMVISTDLGLDSLDMAELVLFLDDEFDVIGVPVIELTTVGRMMAIAEKQIVVTDEEEGVKDLSGWEQPIEKEVIGLAPGKTIPEVFFNNADRFRKRVAMGDDRTGILTYSRTKMAVLILADYIRKLPGKNIGILLPASVGANLTVLACQVAGKIPVMLNWTLGPRHLNSVMETAHIKRVLSSWAFIDRLGNVDLDCIDDELIMLEDAKREIGLGSKIKGLLNSKRKTSSLLKKFRLNKIKENDTAVILFTSGTENAPKGVPLSHKNILGNLKSVCDTVEVYSDDVFFAVLPPFHSFGLTIGCFFGILTGMRIAFYPNPTNGQGMANGVKKWKATVACGAPTFLKAMFKAGDAEDFKSLRWVVSGAEKAPKELFRIMEEVGLPNVLKEGYGVTECSPVLTFNRMGVEPAGVGQPLEGIEIKILHPETHKEMPMGEEGLIVAKGPNVFSGYLNKMVASPFITTDGEEWYNTGDLGFVDELNRVTISGRLKRFIKIGGEMISLAAIENALYEVAGKKNWKVAEEGPSIAVIGQERENEKPQISVVTVFSTSTDEINEDLRNEGFSNLVKVTDVHQMEEIPIMGTGKIFYRELESKYLT